MSRDKSHLEYSTFIQYIIEKTSWWRRAGTVSSAVINKKINWREGRSRKGPIPVLVVCVVGTIRHQSFHENIQFCWSCRKENHHSFKTIWTRPFHFRISLVSVDLQVEGQNRSLCPSYLGWMFYINGSRKRIKNLMNCKECCRIFLMEMKHNLGDWYKRYNTTVYQFWRSVIDHYARIFLYIILYGDQIARISVFMDLLAVCQ